MKLGRSKVWVQGGVSLSIVIPQLVAENFGIKPGDTLIWKIEDGNKIVLELEE